METTPSASGGEKSPIMAANNSGNGDKNTPSLFLRRVASQHSQRQVLPHLSSIYYCQRDRLAHRHHMQIRLSRSAPSSPTDFRARLEWSNSVPPTTSSSGRLGALPTITLQNPTPSLYLDAVDDESLAFSFVSTAGSPPPLATLDRHHRLSRSMEIIVEESTSETAATISMKQSPGGAQAVAVVTPLPDSSTFAQLRQEQQPVPPLSTFSSLSSTTKRPSLDCSLMLEDYFDRDRLDHSRRRQHRSSHPAVIRSTSRSARQRNFYTSAWLRATDFRAAMPPDVEQEGRRQQQQEKEEEEDEEDGRQNNRPQWRQHRSPPPPFQEEDDDVKIDQDGLEMTAIRIANPGPEISRRNSIEDDIMRGRDDLKERPVGSGWLHDTFATKQMLSWFSAFYCLICVTFALVIELKAAIGQNTTPPLRNVSTSSSSPTPTTTTTLLLDNTTAAMRMRASLAEGESGEDLSDDTMVALQRTDGINNLKDWIFGFYMYGGSCLFFLYLYAVILLHHRWQPFVHQLSVSTKRLVAVSPLKFLYGANAKKRALNTVKSTASSTSSSTSTSSGTSPDTSTVTVASVRRVTHDRPAAGSLFLRLGCLVFGIAGVVWHAAEAWICARSKHCSQADAALDSAAVVFMFVQMHFIFANSKISIDGFPLVARFGTMHLVATNLWVWLRYILLEETSIEYEINAREKTEDADTESRCMNISSSACFLASSTSKLLQLAIVEYSLIGAAVLFFVWRNNSDRRVGSADTTAAQHVHRKHRIRVDCSHSSAGLFAGLAFLVFTCVALIVYNVLDDDRKDSMAGDTALLFFTSTEISQYGVATLGCILCVWQMRRLRLPASPASSSDGGDHLKEMGVVSRGTVDGGSAVNSNHDHRHHHQPDALDTVLLCVGMSGELIYSSAGLVGLTAAGSSQSPTLVATLVIVDIVRVVQVTIQSFLIFMASKLRLDPTDRGDTRQRPGKQTITFLLIANIAIFLTNFFETDKPGVSRTVTDFYGEKSWAFLVRSFSPLTAFYRFHSAVCFAEIWKVVYTNGSNA